MKLAAQLADDGELLVRHWLAGSRAQAIQRHPGLANDATDRSEFEDFAPDVVFLEGGLYANPDDWRVPPDVVVDFVDAGGVLIVADVERNDVAEHFDSYAGDIRYFGAALDGFPATADQIRYVRDSTSNDGHPANVICPWPQNAGDWAKDAYAGVDGVLAMAPVALFPQQGNAVLWSAPSATVLSSDYVVDAGRTTPLATAARHGLGYAALIAAAVSPDVVTDRNPANLRWLCNLANLLHERAALEKRLRHGAAKVSRPGGRSPYSERTAAELATLPESKFLEHKQTFAFDIRRKEKNPKLSESVLDRICSFWNTEGGTLLIGVEDRTGRVAGLRDDFKLFKDLDGLINAISNSLHREIGAAAPSIDVRGEDAGGETLLRIDVPAGDRPLYRRDRFFVRVNNTTPELKGEEIQRYVKQRWGA